jgi:DNA-binding transcriptional ArsR family regulator
VETHDKRNRLFDELAVVGKAFGSPKRLELVELLAQGERTVEGLARAAGMGVSTVSAHLQVLKLANLVRTRREGTKVFYRLAGDDVARLYAAMRSVARERSADVSQALEAYLDLPGSGEVGLVTRDELAQMLASGEVTLLDVRPTEEYLAGHIPGARSTPLDKLDAEADALRHAPSRRSASRTGYWSGAPQGWPSRRARRDRSGRPRGRGRASPRRC